MANPPGDSNPLREGLVSQRCPEPCALTIFGATGDLTSRKLLPALYNLAHEGQLPANFAIVGFARRPKTHTEFRNELRAGIAEFSRFTPLNPAVWDALAAGIFYQQGDYQNPADYAALNQLLRRLDRDRGTAGNRLCYLATPPAQFPDIVTQLAAAGIVAHAGSTTVPGQRVVIEKPFGRSLATARQLNQTLTRFLAEPQIYRIDHYLGKETVQNILVLRFANEIFEHLWNQKYVDHVQLTVAETLGVENRGGYYDQAGALRDMVQNHIMQLLALIAMEPPASLAPEAIRDEKVKALRAVRPLQPTDAIRGQYRQGSLAGQPAVAYRDEPGVAPDSRTETYVALKLHLDNWRWSGVPFYLRHGKRLPKRAAEIAIQFKAPPAVLFAAAGAPPLESNVLVIRVQPDEGISLRMSAKVPGTALNIQPVKMDFRYGGSFGARAPDAYERLLHDAIAGDSTLFIRGDEAEQAWTIVDPVLAGWADGAAPCAYEAGTWGPAEADALLADDHRQWRRP